MWSHFSFAPHGASQYERSPSGVGGTPEMTFSAFKNVCSILKLMFVQFSSWAIITC
jgi:hypothetical protein